MAQPREREWIFIRTMRYYKEYGAGSSKEKELEGYRGFREGVDLSRA